LKKTHKENALQILTFTILPNSLGR